jgi:hypothetical protein
VIGELIEAGFAPTHGFDVAVEVNVVAALAVAVVANPALVGIFAGTREPATAAPRRVGDRRSSEAGSPNVYG